MLDSRLAFLDNALGSRKILYRRSKWLVSDFEEDVWHFVMTDGKTPSFQVDFNICLANGTLLTDMQNRQLLNTFKYWINASVHPDNSMGRGSLWADATANHVLRKVFSLIDYFLLNYADVCIPGCGLQIISPDNLKQFADEIISNKLSEDHIYGWSERVTQFLIEKNATVDERSQINLTEVSNLDFTEISDEQIDTNNLNIPLEQVPNVRRWLWNNGYYVRERNGNYKYSINTKPLAKLIYEKSTLMGATSTKSIPIIFKIGTAKNRIFREYPRVPIRNDDKELSIDIFSQYMIAMKALLLLNDEGLSDEGLLLPNSDAINAFLDLKPTDLNSGHFATLPSKVVFAAVKDAIEFHLKYADPLINSLRKFLPALIEKRSHKKKTKLSRAMSTDEFRGLLDPVIRKLGTTGWATRNYKNRIEALRSNKGLGELIRVHHGGVQIVVAAIMARRRTELESLNAKTCLDDTKRWLVFSKAKSTRNLEGRRVRVARPIDEMAVEMIQKLIEIQQIYVDIGLIKELGHLYNTVSLRSPTALVSPKNNSPMMIENVDLFCDYFETPVRKDGKRYYIRPHQLRRFFALSFFWGSGFGGMDTLRWFMGHTDPQHLYHYITETTPGKVLRHAKAQFLSETIEEHAELKQLISAKYGTDDYMLLSAEELEQYIDDLIADGKVDVEPEFIEDANGQSYKLTVLIREADHGG